MTLTHLLAGALGASVLAAAGAGASPADPIAPHRWTSRILVVLAPSEADSGLAEQRRIVAAARQAAAERDLVVVEGVGTGREAAELRRRFGVPGPGFAAILVGKDGGAKLASDRPLAAARLFEEIDAMPMRRDEVRVRGR